MLSCAVHNVLQADLFNEVHPNRSFPEKAPYWTYDAGENEKYNFRSATLRYTMCTPPEAPKWWQALGLSHLNEKPLPMGYLGCTRVTVLFVAVSSLTRQARDSTAVQYCLYSTVLSSTVLYSFSVVRAIKRIHAIEPRWMIFMEGMWNGPYWWGGNCAKLLEAPIKGPVSAWRIEHQYCKIAVYVLQYKRDGVVLHDERRGLMELGHVLGRRIPFLLCLFSTWIEFLTVLS